MGGLTPGYRFEANRGQFDDRVRFLARGSGYGLFLTREGATLSLRRHHQASAVVKMLLVGARPVEPHGLAALPGRSNYLRGNNPAHWQKGVPSYARVRYDGVLPGVDVEYYGTDERQAEYDLLLAAGADPGNVRLRFDGIEAIAIDRDGGAVLRLSGGGELHKPVPVAYQTDARGARVPVTARYETRGQHELGFSLGPYDRQRPLVIDPVLSYSSLLGGHGDERGGGIAIDSAGNAYVTGYTTSSDFPTVAPLQASNNGPLAGNVFVAKISLAGPPTLIYSTYLGGNAVGLEDHVPSIAVDAAGSVYLTGGTSASDFPIVSGGFQTAFHGVEDAFVTKIAPSGASLSYSTFLGGTQQDFGCGLALAGDNVVVTGQSYSSDFPVKAPFQATKASPADHAEVFVTKVSASGTALVYSTHLGGTTEELCGGVAVDGAGNAYVTGTTLSTNFPLKLPLQAVFGGILDAFVTKLDPSGTSLIYSTYLGGSDWEFGNALAVDNLGNATSRAPRPRRTSPPGSRFKPPT